MTTNLLELQIDRPVAGGRMLARHEGGVVLVAGAIPGERVRVRVERVSRRTTWATVTEVLDASPDRRVPACDPACGGSAYAHVDYARQRALKSEIIADAFRRIGKMTLDAPVSVAASPDHGYRLRARLHIRDRRAGFFREGTHVLCEAGPTRQLLPETMAAVEATVAALHDRIDVCEEFVVAENVAATERVLHIVPRDGSQVRDLAGRVACPAGVTGLTTGSGARTVVLGGAMSVTDMSDQLFGASGSSPIPSAIWSRRAASFFQGNRYLTGALVRRVLELGPADRFVDLYSGVGLFAVALAARGGRGLAVEGDAGSGADLVANARPLGERLRVMHATVEEAAGLPLDPAPDLVVLDPPRVGMSPEALTGVIAWAAPRVVYVSCDPPTLARDAARLIAAGYRMESVDGFDLFPNTPHVEAVAAFARG